MIVLRITMMRGRTDEQKEQLIERLTAAARDHLGVDAAAVRVAIVEVGAQDWGIGGQSVAAAAAQRPVGA
jgi:4-oxalocrotonate tautomerase